MNRRHEASRQELFDRTKRRIAVRLQRVCSGMPDAELDALLDHMATIEIKYAMRSGADFFRDKGMEGASLSSDGEVPRRR